VLALRSRSSAIDVVRACRPLAAKEAFSSRAPRLLCAWIGFSALDGIEQRASERFGVETVGASGCDEFAELNGPLGAKLLLFVLQRLELGVDVAQLAHQVFPFFRAVRCG
jgi:hypothetical protein